MFCPCYAAQRPELVKYLVYCDLFSLLRLPDIYSDDESSSQAAKAQWQRIESVLAVAVRSAVAAVVIKDRVVRQTLLMSCKQGCVRLPQATSRSSAPSFKDTLPTSWVKHRLDFSFSLLYCLKTTFLLTAFAEKLLGDVAGSQK